METLWVSRATHRHLRFPDHLTRRTGFGSKRQVAILGAGIFGEALFEVEDALLELWVADGQDLDGEEAGVAGAANRHGGHRYAAGHLDNRKQGVEAFQIFAGDRHTNDGQGSVSGGDAGQMGGAASPGNDDSHSAPVSPGSVFGEVLRGSMGGDDADVVGDVEFRADIGGGFHHRPIGIAAHEDAHERGFAILGFGLGFQTRRA